MLIKRDRGVRPKQRGQKFDLSLKRLVKAALTAKRISERMLTHAENQEEQMKAASKFYRQKCPF
jgi:hypothetical protein